MSNIKVLMVTRELGLDSRYGLGKSLFPIIDEMQASGIPVIYLSQADAGRRGLKICRNIHTLICRYFLPLVGKKHLSDLIWLIIERMNMGRLAVLVSRREQITHVHCHDPAIAFGFKLFKQLYSLFFMTLNKKQQKIKWGITEHGYGSYVQAVHDDGFELSSRAMSFLRKKEEKILLNADWVICPTKLSLQQLARDLSVYPIPKHWYSVTHPVPNFPQLSYIESRKRLEWDDNIFYILAVGRIVPLKQFELLLNACAGLLNKNFKIIILGDGNITHLYEQAEQLGLAQHLNILTTDEIEYYYAAADLYVSCSQTESFGYANLEAMCMGVPVISTAVGGCPEVVANGGELVPVDQHIICETINRVMDDFSYQIALSKRALLRTRQWPTTKQISVIYLDIYQYGKVKKGIEECQIEVDDSFFLSKRLFEKYALKLEHLPAFPETKELVLPENANIIVAVPHPDDETIWCGATLAKLSAKSCHISAILFTDGELGDPHNKFPNESIGERRYQEFKQASAFNGIEEILRLQQADGSYKVKEKVKQDIVKWLEERQPDWIFIPHILEAHRDHILVSLTMLEVWFFLGKKLNHKIKQPRLFFYDGWWPTQASNYVDISDVIEAKQKTIAKYETPLTCVDYISLSKHLDRYRGLSLAACDYAEVFFEITENNFHEILKSMVDLRLKL